MSKPILLEVMKARAGIPTDDLFAMLWAQKLRTGSSSVQTLTGIPPLSFKADGTPLILWSMKGNGSQSGTPTPDNPVMPEFVGTKTANLWSFDSSWTNVNTDTKSFFQLSMTLYNGSTSLGERRLDIKSNGYKYLVSVASESDVTRIQVKHNGSTRDLPIGSIYGNFQAGTQFTISMDVSGHDPTTVGGISVSNIMLNSGSTALPYEPYGWSEKITCAGQTIPVYLGEVPTVRRIKKLVLDGTESWSSEATNMYHVPCDMPLSGYSDAISDRYSLQDGYAKIVNTDGAFGISRRPALFIHDNRYTSVNAWKSYLAAQYDAGTPVIIWYVLATEQTGIVNEPLCKIGTYADEFHSTDAGVTIPTIKGSNTLTVETELQPSEMSITYKG